jgi:hypothetical protein
MGKGIVDCSTSIDKRIKQRCRHIEHRHNELRLNDKDSRTNTQLCTAESMAMCFGATV